MKSIATILMNRDGLTQKEANRKVEIARKDFRKRLRKGELPFDICEEWFSLESDYIDELSGFI